MLQPRRVELGPGVPEEPEPELPPSYKDAGAVGDGSGNYSVVEPCIIDFVFPGYTADRGSYGRDKGQYVIQLPDLAIPPSYYPHPPPVLPYPGLHNTGRHHQRSQSVHEGGVVTVEQATGTGNYIFAFNSWYQYLIVGQ